MSNLAVASQIRTRPKVSERASFWLGLAFLFFFCAVGIGIGWDRQWHTTHEFENFWSPPHLFIYTNTLLASVFVAHLVFRPYLRRQFGDGLPLALIDFEVPGALVLLGGGMLVVGLGGLLDLAWHSTFGLDETGWSLPHAMLGHGISLAAWGFVAAYLALRHGRAAPWLMSILCGWLVLAVARDLIGGPILTNVPPRFLQPFLDSPIVQGDRNLQHIFQIYAAWHLDRTNPLYLPMITFTVGFGLAMVRVLMPQDRMLFGSAALFAAGTFLAERGVGFAAHLWLAPPFLLGALVLVGTRRLGVPDRLAWLVAGWACALWSLLWVPNVLLAVLAGACILLGAAIGDRIGRVIARPTRTGIMLTVALVGLALPALTGTVDLYLRSHTPW